MIRLRDLAMASIPAVGSVVTPRPLKEEAPQIETPSTAESPVDNSKAMLMNIAKQTAEAYNMLGDGEATEPEVSDKITQMCALSNEVYTSLQYKKKSDSATTLGAGEQYPSAQNEVSNPELDAADDEVSDAKKDWVDSMVKREKADSEAAENRQDYTEKQKDFNDKKKKLGK